MVALYWNGDLDDPTQPICDDIESSDHYHSNESYPVIFNLVCE